MNIVAGAAERLSRRILERAFDPAVGGGVDRDKIPARDFAGPERSFPIVRPGDVSDAASSLGRTKHDREQIKRNIIRIAKRKGAAFVRGLPEEWKAELGLKEREAPWRRRWATRRGEHDAYLTQMAQKEASAASSLAQLFRGKKIPPEWVAWHRLRQMRATAAAAGLYERAVRVAHTCEPDCPYHAPAPPKPNKERHR